MSQFDRNATFDLTSVRLARGSHSTREEGLCLLEAVAWAAGEPHSDTPSCVSPVLAWVGRALNDRLLKPGRGYAYEPRLRALVPQLIGTADRPDLDDKAGLMAADFRIRTVLPTLLRKKGDRDLCDYADRFEAMPGIKGWDQVPVGELRAAYRAANTANAYAAGRAAFGAADAADARDPFDAIWGVYETDFAAELYGACVDLYERMIDLYHEKVTLTETDIKIIQGALSRLRDPECESGYESCYDPDCCECTEVVVLSVGYCEVFDDGKGECIGPGGTVLWAEGD